MNLAPITRSQHGVDSDSDEEDGVSTASLRGSIVTSGIRVLASRLSELQLPSERRTCRRIERTSVSSHHSVSDVTVDYLAERVAHLLKHHGLSFVGATVGSAARFTLSHEEGIHNKTVDTVVGVGETAILHAAMRSPPVAVTAGVIAAMKLGGMAGNTIEARVASLPPSSSIPSIDGTTRDDLVAMAMLIRIPQEFLDKVHEAVVAEFRSAP